MSFCSRLVINNYENNTVVTPWHDRNFYFWRNSWFRFTNNYCNPRHMWLNLVPIIICRKGENFFRKEARVHFKLFYYGIDLIPMSQFLYFIPLFILSILYMFYFIYCILCPYTSTMQTLSAFCKVNVNLFPYLFKYFFHFAQVTARMTQEKKTYLYI